MVYSVGAELEDHRHCHPEAHDAPVARNVTFSGAAPVVHYDLSLRTVVLPSLDTPFTVSSVRDTTHL
jgi:hypothetical protein